VLIVGGRIAALALAPMPAPTGIAVEVIEREPPWRHAAPASICLATLPAPSVPSA
jgi:hypothetical protein